MLIQRFFMHMLKERKRKNLILAIKDDSGQWIHDEGDIRSAFHTHFQHVYTSNGVTSDNICDSFKARNPPAINQNTASSLLAPVTMEEVWQYVSRMGSLKAPGPDGLNAHFYEKTLALGWYFCS